MKCKNCGKSLPLSFEVCDNCGTPFPRKRYIKSVILMLTGGILLFSLLVYVIQCVYISPNDRADSENDGASLVASTGTTNPEPTGTDASVPEISDDPLTLALLHYTEYQETAKVDRRAAIYNYCHYEDKEHMEKAAASKLVLNYEILRVEKLSNALWEVEYYIETEQIVFGMYGVHYVGIIDGDYYVMMNTNQIPEDLKEGVTFKPYEPHGPGYIGSDDVLRAD